MAIENYTWSAADRFVGRSEELARLERWWESAPQTSGVNLFGRRRVGKSWMFRRFAHKKPAVILLATEATPAQQFSLLAQQLEPYLGVTPQIKTLDDLFRIIFQLGATEKVLVVLDELPNLLGTTNAKVRSNLSVIQTAIERYRDDSRTKLLICGSAVSQMEDLQKERNPLHGRFQGLELHPMTFGEARLLLENSDPIDQFTRFAITGGMPTYLELMSKGSLETAIVNAIVNRTAPLFNEPQTVLTTELSEPGIYMGILDALALSPASSQELRDATGLSATSLQPYLRRLEVMKLVRHKKPVGAAPAARVAQWECCDHFFRFWFRFVKRYQNDLEAGSDAKQHVANHVRPALADHTAIVFEDEVRRWARREYPEATIVGGWWGNALDDERRSGRRTSEEIDVVGVNGRNVTLIGEVKWQNRKTEVAVLNDLLKFKIPAMRQQKLITTKDARIVICSRGGFDERLIRAAEKDQTVKLITAAQILARHSKVSITGGC
jgi:AAA+ ATPase superfamily predicted ATPase